MRSVLSGLAVLCCRRILDNVDHGPALFSVIYVLRLTLVLYLAIANDYNKL